MSRWKLFITLLVISLVGISPIPGESEGISDVLTEQINPTNSLGMSDSSESESSHSDMSTTRNSFSDIENVIEANEIEGDPIAETKTNATITDPNGKDLVYKIHSNCLTDKVYGEVEIVNATRLMELSILEPPVRNRSETKNDRQSPRTCVLVLFYSRWCVFSSQAAPHFNALPKFFPHIKAVAIDASKYQNFNMQFGIVGVPTLMFVSNGKPSAKFNDTSYTLESFARFVTYRTALEPNGSLYVTSADFSGPIPSTPSNETDYCLVLSWAFIFACGIYFTLQSQWWKQFVELVQNTWRESNAQHEHTD